MKLPHSLLAPYLVLALVACAPPEPEPEPEPCTYPTPSETFAGIGDVPPALTWRGYENHERIDVDLEKFHCGEQWPEFSSILFVLAAEWCPECPAYAEFVGGIAEEIEFNGAKIVFITMEDRFFELASAEVSDNFTSLHTEAGVRVGERDAEPQGFIAAAEENGFWQGTPNAFFLRKRDMQVVIRQQDYYLDNDAFEILPFVKIAQGIELDWSERGNPPFVNNCEADEDSEPNNSIGEAAVLSVGDSFSGGICEAGDDVFVVEHDGPWRLDLRFTHLVADLNIFFVDDDGEILRFPNGDPQGTFSRDDNEVLIGNGNANIMIRARDDQSAPYTLDLSAL